MYKSSQFFSIRLMDVADGAVSKAVDMVPIPLHPISIIQFSFMFIVYHWQPNYIIYSLSAYIYTNVAMNTINHLWREDGYRRLFRQRLIDIKICCHSSLPQIIIELETKIIFHNLLTLIIIINE